MVACKGAWRQVGTRHRTRSNLSEWCFGSFIRTKKYDGGYTADTGSFSMASHVRPSSRCLLFGLLNVFSISREPFALSLSCQMVFSGTLSGLVSLLGCHFPKYCGIALAGAGVFGGWQGGNLDRGAQVVCKGCGRLLGLRGLMERASPFFLFSFALDACVCLSISSISFSSPTLSL